MSWSMKHYAHDIEKDLNSSSKWEFMVVDPSETGHATNAGMKFEVRNKDKDVLFRCVVQPYSACCAFDQLNYFSYNYPTSKESVHEILNNIFVSIRKNYSSKFGRKLVLNTVQSNPEYYDSTDLKLASKPMKGAFYYPFIYEWATCQKAGYLDQPIVNHNTNSIIHHLITFPDVCQPDYELDFDDEDEDE